MRASDRLDTSLRHSEVLYFALLDEILHSSGDVFDRTLRIDAMLVEEIDDVGPEALQSCIRHFADTLRTAVQALLRVAILEAELGGNHHLLAERLNGLAHNFFVHERTICLGRIKKCHAAIECCPDERDRLLPLGCGPVTEAQPHAAQADGGHLEVAFSQFAFLHYFSLKIRLDPVTTLPSCAVVRAIEPVELPPKCEKRERRSFRPHIREGRQLRSTQGPSC